MSSTVEHNVVLVSSDAESFEIPRLVAEQSEVIKQLLEVIPDANRIPLPEVLSKILDRVIKYCKKHAEYKVKTDDSSVNNTAAVDEGIMNWDAEFVEVDHATLDDLHRAADYLAMEGLLDLTYRTMANSGGLLDLIGRGEGDDPRGYQEDIQQHQGQLQSRGGGGGGSKKIVFTSKYRARIAPVPCPGSY